MNTSNQHSKLARTVRASLGDVLGCLHRLPPPETYRFEERYDAANAALNELEEKYESALATIEVLQDKEALSDIIASQTEDLKNLEEQYQAAHDLLVRLRQWDMMVGGIGADGEHHEATADAPYWRDQIDRVLSNPAKERQ